LYQLFGSRLEASACRLEDIADTLDLKSGEYRRRSTAYPDTISSFVSAQSTVTATTGSAKPAQTAASSTAPVAVTPEDAKFVVAYKRDVIEEKLKPFLEFTKDFAGPNVIEMVCFNYPSPQS